MQFSLSLAKKLLLLYGACVYNNYRKNMVNYLCCTEHTFILGERQNEKNNNSNFCINIKLEKNRIYSGLRLSLVLTFCSIFILLQFVMYVEDRVLFFFFGFVLDCFLFCILSPLYLYRSFYNEIIVICVLRFDVVIFPSTQNFKCAKLKSYFSSQN